MAFVCENCGKGITYGRQSSHHRGVAGKRWKKRAQVILRSFKPNIQLYKGVKLCADCISRSKMTRPSRGLLKTVSL